MVLGENIGTLLDGNCNLFTVGANGSRLSLVIRRVASEKTHDHVHDNHSGGKTFEHSPARLLLLSLSFFASCRGSCSSGSHLAITFRWHAYLKKYSFDQKKQGIRQNMIRQQFSKNGIPDNYIETLIFTISGYDRNRINMKFGSAEMTSEKLHKQLL